MQATNFYRSSAATFGICELTEDRGVDIVAAIRLGPFGMIAELPEKVCVRAGLVLHFCACTAQHLDIYGRETVFAVVAGALA
tara:strand:- start:145 stop:390 length:246 start_codon:yes stop_codon:yes gene_type:complete